MFIPEIFADVSNVQADNKELEPKGQASQRQGNEQPTTEVIEGTEQVEQPKTIHERQGNPAAEADVDYSPQITPDQNGPEQFSYEQNFLDHLGSVGKAPVPEYDEEREKRLEVMSGAGGVAKALSVLGDMFSVSQDAPIAGKLHGGDDYVAQILQDKQKYRDKMDESAQQQYLQKIREASGLAGATAQDYEVGKADALRAEDIQRKTDWRTEDKEEAARRFDKQEGRLQGTADDMQEHRENVLELQRDKAIWDNVYKIGKVKADAAKAGAKNRYELVTPDGKTKVPVDTAGELQAIFTAITTDDDPALQKDAFDKLKLMRSKMEGMNSTDLKNFVQEFWHRSEKAKTMLEGMGRITPAGDTPPPPAGVPGHVAAQAKNRKVDKMNPTEGQRKALIAAQKSGNVEEIKKALLAIGWSEEAIDNVLNSK